MNAQQAKNKTLNKINNKLNIINNRIKRQRRRNQQFRRNKIKRRNRNNIKRNILMAYSKNFKRNINSINVAATTARVAGKDLVYSIPDNQISNVDQPLIAFIPANPAYWLGTRVATIAKGYQNYRPIKFNVHYVPHCAATQAGNVIAGTIFHQAPGIENLQQSLKTSNGGIITQAFKPAISHIKVGNNLQKNLYRVGGNIDDDSMPFYFIAIAISTKNQEGQSIIPGYFYVDYVYAFKNPIGDSAVYSNSGLALFNDQLSTMKNQNIKAIVCQPYITNSLSLAIGTALDVEYNLEQQAYEFFYNNTPIDSPPGLLWVLSNEQNNTLTSSQMISRVKLPLEYTLVIPNDPEQVIAIAPQAGIAYTIDNTIHTSINNTLDVLYNRYAAQVKELYYITNLNQNFGTYIPSTTTRPLDLFLAQAIRYFLKQTPTIEQVTPPKMIKYSSFDQYALTQIEPNLQTLTHTNHNLINNVEEQLFETHI